MKFRIRQKPNNNYYVQRKYLFFWGDMKKLCMSSEIIDPFYFTEIFHTIAQAEKAIVRYMKKKEKDKTVREFEVEK